MSRLPPFRPPRPRFRPVLALLALAGSSLAPAAPIPPPLITVRNLFSEVLTGLDERLAAGHWQLSGTQPLAQWPQGDPPAKAAGLLACEQNRTFLPVQVLTAKPVRLTQDPDSLAFFQGVPAGQVPRDGSWVGFKYVFHPNAVANCWDLGDAAGEPLAFYLLRPAPPDLTAADLEPPVPPGLERTLIGRERNAYDDLADSRARIELATSHRAVWLLKNAADAGLVQAQYLDGLRAWRLPAPEDQALARHRFSQAAGQGLDRAQFALAEMLRAGDGGPVDLAEARAQYQLAAAQGLKEAQYYLGFMLQAGEGGPVDLAGARAQYQLAAAQGFRDAQSILAVMLVRGEGGPVDPAGARAQLQLAAAQGSGAAQYTLAIMLRAGEGGPVDLAGARAQLQLAAAQGLKEAQIILATMLRLGEGGPVDLPGARANFQLAAAQGAAEAVAALAAMDAPQATGN